MRSRPSTLDTLVVRTTRTAFCNGTPPGPGRTVTVQVPEHVDEVDEVDEKVRKKVRCKGPAPVVSTGYRV